MDLDKAIRLAVDTGKVEFGSKTAKKVSMHAKAKLVVIASNCPKETSVAITRYAKLSNVPTLKYSGTSLELGSLCGVPYPVSTLSVISEGNSNILEAITPSQ
ncbi:50S ribosomal protein L30e [Candidatus Micrarchaeota archaeon]|nr:50S ribosomal protein L30e [Candidatus Micrarchaeota archaeon]